MATKLLACEWCGKMFPRDTGHATGGRAFCSLSHSVKDQHARKLLGPKVKHNPHGTRARYLKGCRCSQCAAAPNTGGCRCEWCMNANAKYQREHRAKSRHARALAELIAIEKELR